MIPETREFEFANLGFILLSYYRAQDYAQLLLRQTTRNRRCAMPDVKSTSRINARLPIFSCCHCALPEIRSAENHWYAKSSSPALN